MITITLEDGNAHGIPTTLVSLTDDAAPDSFVSQIVAHSTNPKLHAPELRHQADVSRAVQDVLRHHWRAQDGE